MDSRELAQGSGLNRPEGAEAALGAAGAADEVNVTPVREENSGLHEIKALASTTKRRISQRNTSESEAAESLLVGASSGSFRAAAALPDPAREGAASSDAATRARDRLPRPVVRPASEADRRGQPARSSSAPFWLLGGVATAAAAAAVAVFVFGVGREKKADERASATSPESGEVVARATGAAAAASDQSVAAGSPAPGDMRFAEPPPAPAESAPGAAPATATSAPALARAEPEKKAVEQQGDGEGGLKGRAGAAGGTGGRTEHAADSKSDPAREKRDEAARDRDKQKKAAPQGKESGGKDLNDVLDEVTGGVQSPAAPPAEKEVTKKPSKKDLDRRDVAKAMGAVRSQVLRCRDKEQYQGTVTVKFHVAPSGEVTSAEATGSKAGTPTGACVASAVKKARFPAFDGAPTSFTYPFLLAE